MKITLKAYAKLNLALDITGKTDNGYHLIKTVFQSVSLFDRIIIEPWIESGILVECSNGAVKNEANICYTAAKVFLKELGLDENLKIFIKKNIPMKAGLAGGSADAAAVLRGLNFWFDNPFSEKKLLEIAVTLGADVPFCLIGGTVLAEGIGEKLTPLPTCPDCDIVIITDGDKPSTGTLYGKMDSLCDYEKPNIDKMVAELKNKNLEGVCESVRNVFCEAWDNTVLSQKDVLLKLGAKKSELSGSGPSVFGIFDTGKGQKAADELLSQYRSVKLCQPCLKGIEIESVE